MATVVKTHINVFHLPYLALFKSKGYEVHVCAKNDFEIKKDCIIPNCDKYYDINFERFPFKINNIKAYIKLKEIINSEDYEIIHCHTPVASILTRLASIKSRKNGTRVIYTAHGFHFFKGAPIINWLVYYPIEKICSYFTDVLITINKEDYSIAKKKMNAKKIYYVPGVGIDTKKFSNIIVNKEQKRKELGISTDDIMILSVGELSKRKNHEVIIKAISEINRKDVHYFIAGRGNLKKYLVNLSEKLNIKGKVHFLDFRTDIAELCKVSDIFCFPSNQEGLPVALMEAISIGVPIVCSDVRGNNDLIKNDINGILCRPNSVDNFKDAVVRIIENKDFMDNLEENNKHDILNFDIENVMNEMEKIYGEVL